VRPRAGWFHLIVGVARAKEADRGARSRWGSFSGGGRFVMPWFELRIYPTVEMGRDRQSMRARSGSKRPDQSDRRPEFRQAAILYRIRKPGPEHDACGVVAARTARRELSRVPDVSGGFSRRIQDWYISEGGHGRSRKLQANKSRRRWRRGAPEGYIARSWRPSEAAAPDRGRRRRRSSRPQKAARG